jgi:O-antigen/teichoic acid export membrane protein
MSNVFLTDVFLVFIRLLPSAAKLLLLMYLGKFYGDKIVGEYALIASGLALYVILAGFEINAEVSRIVHATKEPEWKFNVASTYLVTILALNIVFAFIGYVISYCSPEIFYISFAIIVLWFTSEHLATEIFRLLIVLNNRAHATFFLFVRVAPALLLPILFDWFKIIKISLELIGLFAIAFNLTSTIALFGFYLFKNKLFFAFYKAVNKTQVIKFLSIVKNFFWGAKAYYAVAIVGSLAANLDKFLINDVIGIEDAGRYYVLSSIAGIYSLLVSFTIGMRQAPELLVSYETDSRKLFLSKYRDATRVLFGLSIPILLVVLIFFYLLSEFFQRELKAYFVEFCIVAVGFFFSSFSTLNRSILLLTRAERFMFVANTLPGILFLLGIYLVGTRVGLIGVCVLFLFTSILNFLLFWYFSHCSEKSLRNEFVNPQ